MWHTDAGVSDIRQTWTTAAERNGMNWGSYHDPRFDVLIDSALATSSSTRMHELFHRAYILMNEDVPAIWLYQAKQVAGMQRRIHPAYMRPDAWWAHLADWYVPAGERIAGTTLAWAVSHRVDCISRLILELTDRAVRRYLVRRVLQAVIVIAVVATVTFFLIRLAPGDPLGGALDDPPSIRGGTPSLAARLRPRSPPRRAIPPVSRGRRPRSVRVFDRVP